MLNSGLFSYVNVLNKSADASWARNEVISNNISNAQTPNYKRQDVKFDSILEQELKGMGTSIDSRVNNLNLDKLSYSTYTDMQNFSYRLDGNNVDQAMEETELASNQIKYQALTIAMNSEFSRLKMAMS